MNTNYQPLNKKQTQQFHWTQPTNHSHLATQSLIPLHAGEVALAASTMPLAITQIDNSWQLVGVAGLEAGRNLFVQQGKWLGRYQPRRLSTYGFDLQTIGQLTFLRFDLNSTLAGGAESMFTAEGELTAAVQQIQEQLVKDSPLFALTHKAVQALADAKVLMPYPDVGAAHGRDLYIIDEKALAGLDDAAFLKLRQAQALGIAYGVNLSVQQSHLLHRLAQMNLAASGDNGVTNVDSLFGEGGDDDTLKFNF